MSKLALATVLAVSLLSGCKKNKVPECEVFLATIEKIGKCDKVPEASRKEIVDSAKTIRDSLKMIEDAGGDVPDDLMSSMKDACKSQETTVREMYEKVAPECLK